ncbi:hypothetical protein EDD18DRAFT_1170331 [Armillaria luteobubalina]|uniref:UBR-type domain-containing protein n=1 Tax=Armillaria luteobubalina TaxID=153913 RepID=A0AA39Q3P1_9AGAR|nr:hypothetical protein EDD18DRAFT_1170331 [Armillaria luteobubalina]
MSSTLTDYIETQDNLLREAAEALPHQFNRCTYPLGSIRQPVYLCLTCALPRGICAACSVACHTDHEQVELFPKRDFRCDCPTSALQHPCTLRTTPEEENTTNHYGQNFKGVFCRCGRPYDPNTEKETMIQCLACEDWFHESCCNLRERPDTEVIQSTNETGPQAHSQPQNGDIDDGASDASSSDLPPPLIRASDYDSFVCASCVRKIPTLSRYAGTGGCLVVIRDDVSAPWRVVTSTEDETAEVDVSVGSKRALSPSAEEPEAKRARTEVSNSKSPCLAPPINPVAQRILTVSDPDLGTGDVFLTEDFRGRWCRCTSCLPSLEANKFLLQEEETYEPPDDPDSGLSLEELGIRALSRIPRERAIDGIHAFNAMRDDLVQYLRPFAQEGKVVDEVDVRAFFNRLQEQKALNVTRS